MRLRPYRLAVLTSHVIQYQASLYRALAADPAIDLTVFFCSERGSKPYWDQGFGRLVKWDVPLLDGYRSEFLANWSPRPGRDGFMQLVNPAIVARLRQRQFDALWVHGWARCTSWLAMLAAFALGIPVLFRGESTLLGRSSATKAAIKRAVLLRLFERIAAFLAIGRYNAEFYQAHRVPPARIFAVPYAVDNEFFLAQAEALAPRRRELKEALGIPADTPVVLYSGKLVPAKRPMDLLLALAQLPAAERATLLYLGDGTLRDALAARARDLGVGVHFAGFQNQTEIGRFFTAADAFVLPSGFEPWGLVVNEAMCFGLPVVVSDRVGAGGDLVRDGVNGFTFPAGDVDALARILGALVADGERRRQMGEASRALIRGWSHREAVAGVTACLDVLAGGDPCPSSGQPVTRAHDPD